MTRKEERELAFTLIFEKIFNDVDFDNFSSSSNAEKIIKLFKQYQITIPSFKIGTK